MHAVRVVARGESMLAPAVTARLLDRFAATPGAADGPGASLPALTEREAEIVRLVAHGLSNSEIAGRLFLSESTVKTYVSRLLTKLDARDRVQVAVLAYESGLVRPASPRPERSRDTSSAHGEQHDPADSQRIDSMPNANTEMERHMAEPALQPSVFDRLLKDRIIWLGSEVRDDNANEIAAKLLLLAAEDPKKDIYLYINSPGGSITAGMAIYDTMQFVPNDIVTVGIGMAASMGQLLLTAGAKGKRYITPNARVLLHQPHGGFGGTASDIQTQAQLILDMKRRLAEITAAATGKTVEQINADGDRDRWFNAEEALEYGFVDAIRESATDVSGGGGTAA